MAYFLGPPCIIILYYYFALGSKDPESLSLLVSMVGFIQLSCGLATFALNFLSDSVVHALAEKEYAHSRENKFHLCVKLFHHFQRFKCIRPCINVELQTSNRLAQRTQRHLHLHQISCRPSRTIYAEKDRWDDDDDDEWRVSCWSYKHVCHVTPLKLLPWLQSNRPRKQTPSAVTW